MNYACGAIELKQTEAFRKWRTKLKDERTRAAIALQARDIKTALRLADEWSG